mgnify:FL=1
MAKTREPGDRPYQKMKILIKHSGESEGISMKIFFRRHSVFAFFLSISLASLCNFGLAEDIESVTVSAIPLKLSEAGSSISIITKEDIAARGMPSIQSLLREVAGFAVSQQGSQGAVTQLRARGAEANQILVLINGVEANDIAQGSEFDFSQLSTSDVERIEIVRGPQSALWGSDALAGVVHVITSGIEQKETTELMFETGSFSTGRVSGISQRNIGNHWVRISGDYRESDGTNISRVGDERDGFRNLNLGISGIWSFSDSAHIDYSIRQIDRETDFDRFDFFVTGLPADAENRTESRYLYAGLSLEHEISDSLNHTITFNRTDSDNETFDADPVNDVTKGTKDLIKYQLNYTHSLHSLSALLEHESQEYIQSGPASFFGDPNKRLKAETKSVAAEYRVSPGAFNISASWRLDNNTEFENANSWRITANRQFGPGSEVFVSAGESVKNPTFVERFGFFDTFIGNPDLEPENSFQWEFGFRSSIFDGRSDIAATYFQSDLKNEINGFVFDPGLGQFTAGNKVERSARSGLELEIDYYFSESFDVSLSYTYVDSDEEGSGGNRLKEVRRPRHIGAISAIWRQEKTGFSLNVSYTGEQADDFFPPYPPFQERVQLSSYTLVSASGYYKMNDFLTLTLRLENVFDEEYEQVFGFRSAGASGDFGLRLSF